MVTNWGYEVKNLPPIISANEFSAANPGLSSSTGRIQAVLGDVSAAVRDYCGWHVAPNLQCKLIGNGEGHLLMLPAMGVTSVESLTIDGVEVEAFEWTAAGMVRISRCFPKKWRSVECVYNAGFASAAVGSVVAQVAANMLVASPGVAEEHVGSAGITYNRTGNGITGGVSLLERDRELLAPYKLARAW